MHDMLGVELKLGQLFAMPFSRGSGTPFIRIGRIVELIPEKTGNYASGCVLSERIRVNWISGRNMPGKPTIVNNWSRGIVLPQDFNTWSSR